MHQNLWYQCRPYPEASLRIDGIGKVVPWLLVSIKWITVQWFYLCLLFSVYSWLSLSRPRLSRITAYLEVKIWSLPKDENLTIDNKILWKRRNCSKGAISPLFHDIFNISRISRVQLRIHLLNVVVRFIFSSILICRCTDISKYFGESLGIRDN